MFAHLNRPRRRVRGVTLTEVMVVVAIVAILAMLAAPNFSAMIERNRINSAANEMLMALQLARSEAIRLNRTATLCPSTDGTTCTNNPAGWESGWIVFHDRDGDGNFDQGPPAATADAVLRSWGALSPRLTLLGSAGVAPWVRYNARGQAIDTGHLIVCNNNQLLQARAILITTTRPRFAPDSNADRIPDANDAGTNFASCTP